MWHSKSYSRKKPAGKTSSAYRSLGDCRDGSDARSTGTFDVDVIR